MTKKPLCQFQWTNFPGQSQNVSTHFDLCMGYSCKHPTVFFTSVLRHWYGRLYQYYLFTSNQLTARTVELNYMAFIDSLIDLCGWSFVHVFSQIAIKLSITVSKMGSWCWHRFLDKCHLRIPIIKVVLSIFNLPHRMHTYIHCENL